MPDDQRPPQTTGAELFQAWFSQSPFTDRLGLRIEQLTSEGAELLMPFDQALTTYADILHGGAITALVDVAATAAAWSGADVPASARGATVGLSLQFVAAGRGDLRASARPLRRGGSIQFLDVGVTDPDGKLIAKALVTYKLG